MHFLTHGKMESSLKVFSASTWTQLRILKCTGISIIPWIDRKTCLTEISTDLQHTHHHKVLGTHGHSQQIPASLWTEKIDQVLLLLLVPMNSGFLPGLTWVAHDAYEFNSVCGVKSIQCVECFAFSLCQSIYFILSPCACARACIDQGVHMWWCWWAMDFH